MKFSQPSNLSIVLLLSVWILTNVLQGTGYAWCLGSAQHTILDVAMTADCSDSPDRRAVADGHPGSCLDLYLVKNDATLAKRLGKFQREAAAFHVPGFGLSTGSHPMLKPPLASQTSRISPVILAHRTVVLLY
jgi:hypothetical protein